VPRRRCASQTLCLADIEPAIFAFPLVKRRGANAMLAAKLGSGCSSFLLFEDANDLFLAESLLHLKVSFFLENSRAILAYF
jgi:hypothetical protein